MSAEEMPETPAEEPDSPSRAAGGCVLAIGAGIVGGVVYAVPELGYFVAGLTITTVARKARNAWLNRGQGVEDEEEAVDIVAVLHELSDGRHNVLLTALKDAAGLPDTKAVRVLLDEASIAVKGGVRAGGKNGPGVHHTSIPRVCDASADGCWCRSDANTNANNAPGEGPEKGFRVEHTGQAGVTVYDLSETHSRRHTAKA
ncbi:hypothetical protein [Streptomyces wedmorensis]